MKEIVVDPFTVDEEINIGYQYDHKATKIVFSGLEDNNYYLKLQDTQSYQAFPIPNNEFEITNTYTQKTLITGQIYRKIDNELIAHGKIFKMSLKTSIPQSNKIKEIVPPAFKNEYDHMVDTTNEINKKLISGEFNGENGKDGKDGKDYEHSEEFEKLSKDIEKNALNSANNASSALTNANKAKEHLDNVNSAVNTFNADYTTKVESFNTAVENANNTLSVKLEEANTDLDTKITEANSSINTKVTTATEQAQKATDEANRAEQATDGKLDKNLGVENAGKSLVVGENGEVVCGESGINEDEVNKIIDKAIDEKLYTQEEVDYMLADKMDKPYVPITITDNATINDALEGNFKIDTIKGNTYQNVETDIVPTPNRPVPINSRKVKAGDEYVELRSLKESENLFDEKLAIHGYVTSAGEIVSSNVGKRNEKLSDFIPTNNATQLSFYINVTPSGSDNDIDTRLWYGISFYDSNKTFISRVSDFSDYTIENITVTNTINVHASAKYFRFSYRAYEDGKASVVLGAKTINSYIPPTVRDYKIVDHANKTAKIIRNVRQRLLTAKNNFYRSGSGGMEINLKDGKLMNRNESAVTYCNLFNHHVSNTIPNNLCYRLDNNYLQFNYEGYNEKTLWDKFITDNELYIQYQLATPVEETITYVETDTSEVGYSWQDTTSPSLTIPSEVKGVEEIDILKTRKNLFDIEGHEFTTNLQSGKVSANRIVKVNNTTLRIQNPNVESYAVGDKFVVKANEPLIISFDVLEITGTKQINVVFYKETGSLLKSFEYRTIKVGTRFVIDTPITTQNNYVYIGFQSVGAGSIVTISNILLEHASIATEYEPYKEQHIAVTLPQPMFSTANKKISDIANIENKQCGYYLKKVVFDGTNAMFTYLSNSNNVFYTILDDAISPYEIDTKYILCENLTVYPANFTTDNFVDNSIKYGNGSGTSKLLFIKINDTITTADMLYMWLKEHPITVYYVVQTPTTLPIPEDDLAKLKSLKTNVGVNNIFINSEVKPSIEARYPQNVVLAVNRLQTKLLTLQKEVINSV